VQIFPQALQRAGDVLLRTVAIVVRDARPEPGRDDVVRVADRTDDVLTCVRYGL
jgi:hypothetical protein